MRSWVYYLSTRKQFYKYSLRDSKDAAYTIALFNKPYTRVNPLL